MHKRLAARLQLLGSGGSEVNMYSYLYKVWLCAPKKYGSP